MSLFQENEQPKTINVMFVPTTDTTIAEPIGIQINKIGSDIIQMHQSMGIVNGGKVPGLESILNYMNENLFSKDDPATIENHYHITNGQYN